MSLVSLDVDFVDDELEGRGLKCGNGKENGKEEERGVVDL